MMPLPEVTIKTGADHGFRVVPQRSLARSVFGFVGAISLLFAAFFGVPDLLAYFEASAVTTVRTDFLVEMPAAMLDEPRAGGTLTKAAFTKP